MKSETTQMKILTDEIVKLVSNYKSYFEDPNYEGPSVLDEWELIEYWSQSNKENSLSDDELNRLENLLSEVKSFSHMGEQRFEEVLSFINFIHTNPIHHWRGIDEEIYNDMKRHFIDGEPKEQIWICECCGDPIDVDISVDDEIRFYETHHKIETYDKLLPLKIRKLREYLNTFKTLH